MSNSITEESKLDTEKVPFSESMCGSSTHKSLQNGSGYSDQPVVLTMWKPAQNAKPLFDNIFVTDVTSNMTTITVKECMTDDGFFRSGMMPMKNNDETQQSP